MDPVVVRNRLVTLLIIDYKDYKLRDSKLREKLLSTLRLHKLACARSHSTPNLPPCVSPLHSQAKNTQKSTGRLQPRCLHHIRKWSSVVTAARPLFFCSAACVAPSAPVALFVLPHTDQ